ncbi:MAG TPA: hypothetical protein DC046_14915, partial [Rhodospirillaceae bacterium]|nr:hypothetical protein [Rhodospirillaceae bacterium]
DGDFPIAAAALHLAAARLPGLNLGPYERHLARLTAEVADYAGPGTPTLAGQYEALIQVIDRRYGYGGNESVFEDLDAANLARVIDTRRGLPVALGIVYMEVCNRLGWSLVGLDFPGRFLVRLEDAGGRMILDLFEGGRELMPPDLRGMLKTMAGADAELHPRYLSEMTARQVVLRLEDNIRVRQMQRGELADAADTISLMLLVAPDTGHLWREAGIVNARLDRVARAVEALEEYLKRAPGEENGYEASLLLQELRAKLN